jgi:Glycosyl hydrolase catalytic core
VGGAFAPARPRSDRARAPRLAWLRGEPRPAAIAVGTFRAMRVRLFLSALIVVVVLSFLPATAMASVPQGFVGMMADGPFFYPAMDQGSELDSMIASGVQSVRTLVNWGALQPYASESGVPPALRGEFADVKGVPTNFTGLDQLVALAAMRRLTVLPILEYAPRWDSLHPGNSASPPRSPGPFASFVAALVGRYGPRGTFWPAHPTISKVPIRMWQVWNEPDFTVYWSKQPFERSYVALLKATHLAMKAADHGAKLVAAGLPNFSWQYLATMYRLHARDSFDAVAVHPYTATPQGAVTILKKVRAVMNKNGDRRKPILATELSWPSAKGKARTTFENATTEAGQATKVAQAVRLLAANRRKLGLAAFYYYSWITNESAGAGVDQFNFAGLLRFLDGRGTFVKPALATFTKAALAIEGCRRKGALATICIH